MSIFVVLLVIIIVGFALWLVDKFVPMSPVFKYIMYGVVVICLLIWILQSFGLIGSVGNLRIR